MKDLEDDKTLDMFGDDIAYQIDIYLKRLDRLEFLAKRDGLWPGIKKHNVWIAAVLKLKELGYEEPETPRSTDPQDEQGQG